MNSLRTFDKASTATLASLTSPVNLQPQLHYFLPTHIHHFPPRWNCLEHSDYISSEPHSIALGPVAVRELSWHMIAPAIISCMRSRFSPLIASSLRSGASRRHMATRSLLSSARPLGESPLNHGLPARKSARSPGSRGSGVLDVDAEDALEGVDINMKLDPVDVGKLALPLHLMDTISQDVIDNIIARDKTIVFSPNKKRRDVYRRLLRMKHRSSIQPLGQVLHLRFFPLRNPTNRRPADISLEDAHRIREKLCQYTRYLVTDNRWPTELSLDANPVIQQQREQMGNPAGTSCVQSVDDVMELLSRVLSNELNLGAWCGVSCTPVLAKMACDECHREYKLRPRDYARGGIVANKDYSLSSHEEAKAFVRDLPLSVIPVLGQAQVKLLKDVFGITKCGEIAEQELRLGFSLSPSTMEYFLSVAYGTVRLPSEVATTLVRKVTRWRTANLRRESQFGRVVTDEQFLNTVTSVFESAYNDIVAHDFVVGAVLLESRRCTPSVRWEVEEVEELDKRTNDHDLLRDITLRLAKRFAPRRIARLQDSYSISVHFRDACTWDANRRHPKNRFVIKCKKATGDDDSKCVAPVVERCAIPTTAKQSATHTMEPLACGVPTRASEQAKPKKRPCVGGDPLRKDGAQLAMGIQIVV
ncbi:unnamed protein product [Trypanosoma congolense IL3000]|uniref:WGS project CAEQ00000000 data, annotated contig 2414 n=1 Tax=Trypanosoma congolense (strain IL3000) TaxID=1068625 RepID=F9WDX1_TRYCI|nr:unnamed protein product [Trypanosoma congolense IL3000]